jgi:uncharacterized protein (DUF2336 family)
MIVRQFLQWVRTATVAERADATSALARAFLYSNLSADDRLAAEGALLMSLDDPSPIVRSALARALASSELAPPAVILALVTDLPEISAYVLEHSPLLMDADLVDAVATCPPAAQAAIAKRHTLPCAVAAAVAEVGCAEACLVLLENHGSQIPEFSSSRIVERFGHLAAIREAMLERDGLPASTRQAVIVKLSETLVGFVATREWLEHNRAMRVAKEACEKATITLASVSPSGEIRALVSHLRESGQLNAGMMLRALLSGNIEMFEQAISELAGVSVARVRALVHDRGATGFRAIYAKAGLPASAFPAFREAVDAIREGNFMEGAGGSAHLKRRIVERVLTRCADLPMDESIGEFGLLLTLLRRFAAEAAREDARAVCNEIISENSLTPQVQSARAA